MYKLLDEDVKLLKKLLLMKDWNPEDGYSKECVIEYVNANRELNNEEINQTFCLIIHQPRKCLGKKTAWVTYPRSGILLW